MWTRLGRLLVALAAAFLVSGAGQHQPSTAGPEDGAAAAAVAVLTGLKDGDPAAAIPADFADIMGYAPALVTAGEGSVRLVKPSGTCSSALGGTSYGFDAACRTHDLGYDLLRYATRSGGELGPWARRAVDDMFAEDLQDRCDAVDGGWACSAAAALYSATAKANSWRQGYGNPGSEDPGPYITAALLLAAAVAGPWVAARARRRRPVIIGGFGVPYPGNADDQRGTAVAAE